MAPKRMNYVICKNVLNDTLLVTMGNHYLAECPTRSQVHEIVEASNDGRLQDVNDAHHLFRGRYRPQPPLRR
jgi:hypothetical protein